MHVFSYAFWVYRGCKEHRSTNGWSTWTPTWCVLVLLVIRGPDQPDGKLDRHDHQGTDGGTGSTIWAAGLTHLSLHRLGHELVSSVVASTP